MFSGDALDSDSSAYPSSSSLAEGDWFGRVVIHGDNGCSVVASTAPVPVFEQLVATIEKGPDSCESTNTGRSTTAFTGTPDGGNGLVCRYIVELEGVGVDIGPLGAFAPCTRGTPYTSLDLESLNVGVGTFDVSFEVQDTDRDSACPIASVAESFTVTEVTIVEDPVLLELCQDGFDYQVRWLAVSFVPLYVFVRLSQLALTHLLVFSCRV